MVSAGSRKLLETFSMIRAARKQFCTAVSHGKCRTICRPRAAPTEQEGLGRPRELRWLVSVQRKDPEVISRFPAALGPMWGQP
jgi:hypothetical protein